MPGAGRLPSGPFFPLTDAPQSTTLELGGFFPFEVFLGLFWATQREVVSLLWPRGRRSEPDRSRRLDRGQ